MHIFERDWHPGNIYSTKWRNGAKNGLTVWSGKNLFRLKGVTFYKSPVKDIAFRHYFCSYNVNFVLSILKVIDQLECKLRCYQKLYGQMQKTTDNVLFDYWRGFAGVNRSVYCPLSTVDRWPYFHWFSKSRDIDVTMSKRRPDSRTRIFN